jgi:hypothetical protein
MATGPGIDEDWLRLRPRLPPGGVRLAVRGLRHCGWRADLWLDRRRGTPTLAEEDLLRRGGDEHAASAADGRQWMQGAVAVHGGAGSRCVVVHGPAQQFVARLRSGDALEFAWPGDASGSSARASSDR